MNTKQLFQKSFSIIHRFPGGRVSSRYLASLLLSAMLPSVSWALDEVKWNHDGGGVFTDAANWNDGSALPQGGSDYGTLDRNANYTVTFLDGGTASFSPQFKTPINDSGATEIKKLVLDFLGTFEWTDAAEDGNYQGEPFKFYGGNGHFFNWENGGNYKKYGPAVVNNAKVTLWQDDTAAHGGKCEHLLVERGDLSMRTNATDGTSLNYNLVVGAGVPDGNAMEVVFDNGASGQYFNGEFRMNGLDCLFAVRGGSDVRFRNDLNFPGAGDTTNRKNTLEVSGEDSYLKVPNFRLLNNEVPNRDVNVIVKDGGVLDVSNEFRQNNKGYAKIFVSNEGELKIRSTGGNFLKQADSRIDIDITDNGILSFTGGGRWGWNESNPTCEVNLFTSGGTVRFVNEYAGRHDWNRSWIVDEGTKIEIGSNMTLAFADNTPDNHAAITADFSAVETTGDGYLELGRNWPTDFYMTNGTMSVGGLLFGRSSTATTRGVIGGTAQVTVRGDGLSIGYDALTTLVLKDDAVLDVNQIRTSRSGGYGTNTFEQVGGTLRVSGGVNMADDGNAKGVTTFSHFGGDMYSPALRGWSGAKWRGGGKAATCVFQGNGGTLHPFSGDTEDFLWGFDEAYLGEQGLTVDTQYRVQIRQDFAKMDGESKGVLILKGSGLKQICQNERSSFRPAGTGAPTETVCAGGKTVFGNGIAWETDLVVTNGAIASFADPGNSVGNSSGMTLSSLTLGDAETVGYLELDSGDQVVVDGPVSFLCAQLMFTSTPGNGTYPVIKVLDAANNLSSAARTAWARMILAAGHAASGHAYEYTITEDETDGSVTLSVVIKGAVPLESEDILVYDADGSETLADDVTVGAVQFDSEGTTTVSGTGSIGFKDSGYASITVTQGDHEIAVPLATSAQLPVNVADGAKLTLSASAGLAGIAMNGPGGLALEDLSRFPGKLSLKGGVTTLGTAGVTEETHVANVAVESDEAKTPVGVMTASPIVFDDITYSHGLFAKAGAAPLVIERNVNQDKNIFGDEPNDPQNASLVFTDKSLTQSEDPYGGLTVVEGDFVFRGTAGDASNPDTLGRYNGLGKIVVGARSGLKENAVAPRLVFDHVRVHSNKHSYFPGAFNPSDTPWTDAGIVVTNGAFVHLDSMHMFNHVSNVNPDARPLFKIDVSCASTFSVFYECGLMQGYNRGRHVVSVRDGSYFLAGYENGKNNGFVVAGDGIDVTLSGGSHFGAQYQDRQWQIDVRPGKLYLNNNAFDNHFRFTDGSVFHCDYLRLDNTGRQGSQTNTFHFANGSWDVGDTDYNFAFQNGDKLVFVAEGEGLVLSNGAGRVWNFYSGITGTDVVKKGAGTLVFQKNAYLTASTWGPSADLSTLTENTATSASLGITGLLRVEEGTVKFADGSAAAGTCALTVSEAAVADLNGQSVAFTAISGAGVVTNGTLNATTLEYGDGSAIPTFSDVAGTVTVDFGRTAEDPLDEAAAKEGIVVGHYTGDAPAELSFRSTGTGLRNYRASVLFDGGDIVLKYKLAGFVVFIQ